MPEPFTASDFRAAAANLQGLPRIKAMLEQAATDREWIETVQAPPCPASLEIDGTPYRCELGGGHAGDEHATLIGFRIGGINLERRWRQELADVR